MYFTISNCSSSLKWAVLVGITVLLAIVASNGNSSNSTLNIYLGHDFDANGVGQASMGTLQNSRECTTASDCPGFGPGRSYTVTACCSKDVSSGKSYCSYQLSSDGSNDCPQLITATTAEAANEDINPLNFHMAPLFARSGTFSVYIPYGKKTASDQPVTVDIQGDHLAVSIIADNAAGSYTFLTAQIVYVENVVLKIVREYLKKLGSEEIIRLLDKEIVQQIVERHSSEILDEKVMEVN